MGKGAHGQELRVGEETEVRGSLLLIEREGKRGNEGDICVFRTSWLWMRQTAEHVTKDGCCVCVCVCLTEGKTERERERMQGKWGRFSFFFHSRLTISVTHV